MVIDLENYKFSKQHDRVMELFQPVHDQLIEEDADFLGMLYSIIIDLVMRNYAMRATVAEYDKGADKVYDDTVAAIHKLVDEVWTNQFAKRRRKKRA